MLDESVTFVLFTNDSRK